MKYIGCVIILLCVSFLHTECDAIEAPQLKVQPFTGFCLHIAPDDPNVKVIDGMAGVSIGTWYSWRLGFGATSYSYGPVLYRSIWIIPVGGFLHFGHVWGEGRKPWVFGSGLVWFW